MNEYKLLLKVGQVTGATNLINRPFDPIVDDFGEGWRCINADGFIDDGELSESPIIMTERGVMVSPSQGYRAHGFMEVYYYSVLGNIAGFSEEDWEGFFVSSSIIHDDYIEIPGGVNAVRLQGPYIPGVEINDRNFHIAIGSGEPVFFGTHDKWERLDIGNEKPALTLQNNDLAELKDRQADYTQELTLPPTGHNLRVLGSVGLSDSETDSPYRLFECRLFAGDHLLMGRGSSLSVRGVSNEGIECTIVGAEIDFFEALRESPMGLIAEPSVVRSEGGLFVPSGDPGVLEAQTIEGAVIAYASFFRGGEYPVAGVSPAYTLPFVYAQWLFKAIVEAKGFTWSHNLADYPGLDRIALPVVDDQADEDSFDDIKNGYGDFMGAVPAGGVRCLIPTITNNAKGLISTVGVNGSTAEAYTVIQSSVPCRVELTVWLNFPAASSAYPANIHLSATANGEDVLDYSYTGEGLVSPDDQHVISVSLQANSPLVITAVYGSAAGTPAMFMVAHHGLDIDVFESERVPIGGKLHLPKNLGFETQGDFAKAFIQAHGLFVSVDRRTSEVSTYTMKEVYDRKDRAVDWTMKLVGRQSSLQFNVEGYAQSNEIKMKDNSEDSCKDKGTFSVDDKTLPASKVLFELGFEAGLDWMTNDGAPVANIPVFDMGDKDLTDSERRETAELSPGEPHLVSISPTKRLVKHHEGPMQVRCKVASHTGAKVQDLLDTFFQEITGGLLDKAKMVTADFYLTPLDIEMFDPFTPVYLKQHGAFFYVNKISNFVSGQLTTVELIKL